MMVQYGVGGRLEVDRKASSIGAELGRVCGVVGCGPLVTDKSPSTVPTTNDVREL